jgi:hypothetical protein
MRTWSRSKTNARVGVEGREPAYLRNVDPNDRQDLGCYPERIYIAGHRGRGGTCGFVIFPPQPGTKTETANGPGFSVPIDHEIRKRGAIGGVKQLRADRQVGKHISGRYLVPCRRHHQFNAASIPVNSVMRLGPRDLSFKRVSLHKLRATLTGSMPTCFDHARSSLTR